MRLARADKTRRRTELVPGHVEGAIRARDQGRRIFPLCFSSSLINCLPVSGQSFKVTSPRTPFLVSWRHHNDQPRCSFFFFFFLVPPRRVVWLLENSREKKKRRRENLRRNFPTAGKGPLSKSPDRTGPICHGCKDRTVPANEISVRVMRKGSITFEVIY